MPKCPFPDWVQMQLNEKPFGVTSSAEPEHLRHYAPIVEALDRAWAALDRDSSYDEELVTECRALRLPYLERVPYHSIRLWRERWWDVMLLRQKLQKQKPTVERIRAYAHLFEANLLIWWAAEIEAKEQEFLHILAEQKQGQPSSPDAQQSEWKEHS